MQPVCVSAEPIPAFVPHLSRAPGSRLPMHQTMRASSESASECAVRRQDGYWVQPWNIRCIELLRESLLFTNCVVRSRVCCHFADTATCSSPGRQGHRFLSRARYVCSTLGRASNKRVLRIQVGSDEAVAVRAVHASVTTFINAQYVVDIVHVSLPSEALLPGQAHKFLPLSR